VEFRPEKLITAYRSILVQMFEEMIGELETLLEEIDSLVSQVESMSDLYEPHFIEWSANGSILDGGRSIRIKSFGLDGLHNVYDVLSSMHTVFHTGS